MKKHLILLISILTLVTVDAENVMVFRKNGVVDLFNSEFLSTILCSSVDTDGIDRGTVEFQHFVRPDTVVVIPVADIDSVTFCNRNSIIPKSSSRRIQDSELPFISGFDGNTIRYVPSAPTSIIPISGTLIYYDNFCDVLPYGLSARVKSVTKDNDGYSVSIEEVHPKELFDSFIISGDYELTIPIEALRAEDLHKANDDVKHLFEIQSDDDNVNLKMGGYVTISFRNLVASVLTGYYHADIDMSINFDVDMEINSDDDHNSSCEFGRFTLSRSTVAGVLYPRLDLALFAELEAKLRLKYNLQRSFKSTIEWTRHDNQNFFSFVNNSDEDGNESKSSADILLDGAIYSGLLADLSFNTLFNRVGAGVTAKIGPKFSGEFGFGILSNLAENYTPELSSKSHIELSMNVEFEPYYYRLENIAFGENIKTILPFGVKMDFFKHTLNLLPELRTRAVRTNGLPEPALPYSSKPTVDIATTTETSVEHVLEIGFEVVGKYDNSVVERQFSDIPILQNTSEKQGFNKQIAIGEHNPEDIFVRPVIRYADYIIKCQPSDILNDVAVNPITNCITAGDAYSVGGASIIGQSTNDETTFIVGNIMPVLVSDSVTYGKEKRAFKTCAYLNDEGTHTVNGASIFDTWSGKFRDMPVNITIRSDKSAVYNQEEANFELNQPQSGAIKLIFDDDRTLVMFIHEISSSTMNVSFQNSNEIIILEK